MRKIIVILILVLLANSGKGQNTMNDEVLHFYHYFHYPLDPLTFAQFVWPNFYISYFISNNEWENGIVRSVRFVGKFRSNCYYDLENANNADWNKLMSIHSLPQTDFTSVRLGWRRSEDQTKMELGLYGHVGHMDNEVCEPDGLGREFFYLTEVNLDETFEIELYISPDGIYVVANGIGGAIRRHIGFAIIFSEFGYAGTAISRSGYFGGNETAPHNMQVELTDIVADNSIHFWPIAITKTYGRSIFYGNEVIRDCAQKKIILSIDVEAGQYSSDQDCGTPEAPIYWSEIEDYGRYVTIKSDADVIMAAEESVKMLPGFHAENGCHFIATTDHPIDCGGAYDENKSFNNDYSPFRFLSPTNKDEIVSEYMNINTDDEEFIIKNKDFLNENLDVLVYPNPSYGELNILISEQSSELKFSVEIVNVIGEVERKFEINSTNFLNIDLSDMAKGMYIIRIYCDEKTFNEKIIIK